MTDRYNITGVGLNYVGVSLTVLLARQHRLIALAIDAERLSQLLNGPQVIPRINCNTLKTQHQILLKHMAF